MKLSTEQDRNMNSNGMTTVIDRVLIVNFIG